MKTAVYFVKNNKIVGVGQGYIAWELVNGVSILESMRHGWDTAQSYYKDLKRGRWSQCDLFWKEQMSKWFTTEEDFATFDYAIVMDYKIPSDWFRELRDKSLNSMVLTDRKQAGQLVTMPDDELEKLFAHQ
jgi:hypothetical protein